MQARQIGCKFNALLEFLGDALDDCFGQAACYDDSAAHRRSYRAFDTPTYLRRGICIDGVRTSAGK
jgi:hypothetical protein